MTRRLVLIVAILGAGCVAQPRVESPPPETPSPMALRAMHTREAAFANRFRLCDTDCPQRTPKHVATGPIADSDASVDPAAHAPLIVNMFHLPLLGPRTSDYVEPAAVQAPHQVEPRAASTPQPAKPKPQHIAQTRAAQSSASTDSAARWLITVARKATAATALLPPSTPGLSRASTHKTASPEGTT